MSKEDLIMLSPTLWIFCGFLFGGLYMLAGTLVFLIGSLFIAITILTYALLILVKNDNHNKS
jgi:hypothetical protein